MSTSASGNGPTVITIASGSYEQPDEKTSPEDATKRPAKRSWKDVFKKNEPIKLSEMEVKNVPNERDATSASSAKNDAPQGKYTDVEPSNESIRTPEVEVPIKLSFEDKLYGWARDAKPTDDPLQLALWWLYVHLYLHFTPLDPPKKVSSFRIKKVIASLREASNYAREETAAIIGVIATKGGVGKTTVSTWLAVVMTWATKLSVAVVDTDRSGGLVTSRFGLRKRKMSDGQTKRALSIYELGKRVEAGEIFSQEKLIQETVSDSETGVMVFRAPPGQGMSIRRTHKTLRHVRSQFAGGLVVDTTPGTRVPMSNAVAVSSDVRIIVAQGISDESIMGVRTALNYDAYGLRDSIERVLVVFVALPVRKCNARTAHEFAARLNLRPTKEALAEKALKAVDDEDDQEDDEEGDLEEVPYDQRIKPSQVLFLPQERYMDNHKVKELEPVRFSAIRPRTQLALAELLAAKDRIVLEMKRKAAESPIPQGEEEPPRSNLTAIQQRASA